MKKILYFVLFAFSLGVCAQNKTSKSNHKPKLVIGIVVDQMRYDYLYKFYDKYGDDGFKRLMNDGFSVENAQFNYVPTFTAVGHSAIFTGTTPSIHGVISNNWYDKYLKKSIYCVSDKRYNTVGASKGGEKSPYRLQVTTITDQLHLAQNMKGKVIGISLKDRAAILPAGHTANAAYWFEGENTGKFISSSYYLKSLPKWVKDFNNLKRPDFYLSKPWKTLYPIDTYTESIKNGNDFSGKFKGEDKSMFPHDIPKLVAKNDGYDLIKSLPFGNDLTEEFAEAAIKEEHLGKSKYVDFLTLSFSSTDYVGHRFGVASKEIEDTYIRFDKTLAKFLTFLDNTVGKNNYVLFLTADHGAVQVPSYLKTLKIPAGYFDKEKFKEYVNNVTQNYFNSTELVENISNNQIFLNKEKIKELNLDLNKVEQTLVNEIIKFKGVYKVLSARTLQTSSFASRILQDVRNGYNQKYSGDVIYVLKPATISYHNTGSTHGSSLNYDTHVPLLFYGNGINKGMSNSYTPIINIAPTIASLLHIQYPNGCVGNPIPNVLSEFK